MRATAVTLTRWRVPIAALASALLLWIASPAVGVGWLAWVALVPVAGIALAERGTRGGRLAVPLCYVLYLWLLFVPAFPFRLAEGQWGDPVVPVLIGGSPVVAIVLVAIPLVGVGLYLARFGQPWGAERLPGGLATVGAVAIPALAWAALDFTRAMLDPGALWGPLYLSQAEAAPGALAALGGPWLISLAIVVVNYGVAAALVTRSPLPAVIPAVAVAALVSAGAAFERGASDGERSVRVAAVQPGYDTAERERQVLRRFRRGTYHLAALDLIDDLAPATRAAAGGGAELVVWPQATMYVDPRGDADVRQRLERLARSAGVSIVVPFFLPSPVREDYLLAAVSAPEGASLTDRRPKHRPLWFLGENRARGKSRPLEVGPVRLGALLGVDAQDPAIAGRLRDQGAELLISVTHDWRQSAPQHRAYAQLAARSAGAPLVRADWRYGSAVYSARGSPLADAGSERRRTTIDAEPALAGARTPFSVIGNLLGWLALAITAVAALAALAATRRDRSPGAPASRGAAESAAAVRTVSPPEPGGR